MRPEDLGEVWPEVAPELARALARGRDHTTLGEVRRLLEEHWVMLWVVYEGDELVGSLVMQCDHGKNCLEVWLMAGQDLADWAPEVSPLLERYAREQELERVEATIRPGMMRVLSPIGWRHRQTIAAIEV